VLRLKNVWSCTSTPPIRLHCVVLKGAQGQYIIKFMFWSLGF